MDNKEIKYLKNENGNPIKCGFEGKCNNYATIDIGIDGNVIPICEEHRQFLNGGYWYIPDKDGIYHPSKELPNPIPEYLLK